MTTKRVPLEAHPQGRKLLGAVARAERIQQHLESILWFMGRGIGTPTELAKMRSFAREVDAMWKASVQKRSIEHELPMRFLDAVDHAARLEASAPERAAYAAKILAARLPEHTVGEQAFINAMKVWRRPRRSWKVLREIIRAGVTTKVPDSPGALRVQFARWRQGSGH